MNIKNFLIGTAIGDAFGAGVEFQDRNWIREQVDFTTFVDARSRIQVSESQKQAFVQNYQAWDYTDDTEMTIGLLRALMDPLPFSTGLLVQKWEEEYKNGIEQKGFGRNGHGSMSWYYEGTKTIEEIRAFQRNRPNPGNAPAMRVAALGLLKDQWINTYAAINANATHPNQEAILSSQCVAQAASFIFKQKGAKKDIMLYCRQKISLNKSYQTYLEAVDKLPTYDDLTAGDFEVLCGQQPIEKPYFLAGICGVPSDSKFTAGCVLYVLKHAENPFDALRKSIYLGGDVDSIASITTGILAGKQGLESIPSFMQSRVEGVAYLTEIAQQWEHSRDRQTVLFS